MLCSSPGQVSVLLFLQSIWCNKTLHYYITPRRSGPGLTFLLSSQLEHNSFEDIPWINRLVEFTQQVLAQNRVRILGICFGHQILGRAMGAKVGRSDQGWEIAVCDMELTEKGKEIFGLEKIVRGGHSPQYTQ